MAAPPTTHCPCQGRFLEEAFTYTAPPAGETPFDLGGQRYYRAYQRCTLCGHWFAQHDLDLTRLYDHQYVQDTYGGAEGLRRRFETIMALPAECSDNRERIACFLEHSRKQGLPKAPGHKPRLLDVGAGLGVFPAGMVEAGWDVTALEQDARAVAHLREVVGISACDLSLEQYAATHPESFDAVTFNKVLEHVLDPTALLTQATVLLGNGGFVYFEVPDGQAAAVAGKAREEFFIEHHHVFSPASALFVAERAGLGSVTLFQVREPSGKYTLRVFAIVHERPHTHGWPE